MPSLPNAWKKLRWSLEQRGVGGTLRMAAGRISAAKAAPVPVHPFDLRYGVDTGGFIGGGDLTAGHAHDRYITGYIGISPSRFEATMRRWRETPPAPSVARVTFVDLGCGKGRALLLASQQGFREVIGVELNRPLAEAAERNLAVWEAGGHGGCPIRVACGDATEFLLPPGPCLIYLANPFGAPVLRALLKRLEERAPEPEGALDVVYQNPEQEAVFEEFPAFARLWSEVMPYTEEAAAVDLFYSATDRCSLYRR